MFWTRHGRISRNNLDSEDEDDLDSFTYAYFKFLLLPYRPTLGFIRDQYLTSKFVTVDNMLLSCVFWSVLYTLASLLVAAFLPISVERCVKSDITNHASSFGYCLHLLTFPRTVTL